MAQHGIFRQEYDSVNHCQNMTNMSCNHKYWGIINGEVNILLMTNNDTDGVVVGKFQIFSGPFSVQ